MKEQKYISYFLGDKNKQLSFERWSNKSLAEVIASSLELARNTLYKTACDGTIHQIVIYSTPDGYAAETKPVATLAKELWL